MPRTLLVVEGACHGVGMKLDLENLAFGPVIRMSSMSRELNLANVGDIGCKFRWDIDRMKPNFRYAKV